MWQILLTLLYTALLAFFIYRSKWFKAPALSKKTLAVLFLIKVLAAITYGLIQKYYYGYGDTFRFFDESGKLFSLLPQHPIEYLKALVGPTNHDAGQALFKLIGTEVKHYGLPRSYFMVQFHAFLRLFSFGHYYVHAVFFAFISFVGTLNIYRFFAKNFNDRSLLFAIFLFITPSVLYWGSGAHKGSLVILSLGIIFYALWKLKFEKKYLHVFLLLLGCWLMYQARDYAFLLFVPALLGLLVVLTWPKHAFLKFVLLYTLSGVLFFNAKHIHPTLNIPEKFTNVQDIFLRSKGKTTFTMEKLEPTFESFIKLVPVALINATLRPFPTNIKTWFHLASFINLLFVISIILRSIVFHRYAGLSQKQRGIFWFCIFYSLSYLIMIGLMVTNTGALARYRSVAFIFLLLSMIILGKWDNWIKKLKNILTIS